MTCIFIWMEMLFPERVRSRTNAVSKSFLITKPLLHPRYLCQYHFYSMRYHLPIFNWFLNQKKCTFCKLDRFFIPWQLISSNSKLLWQQVKRARWVLENQFCFCKCLTKNIITRLTNNNKIYPFFLFHQGIKNIKSVQKTPFIAVKLNWAQINFASKCWFFWKPSSCIKNESLFPQRF